MRSGLEARRTISGGMAEFSRRGGLKQPPTVVAQFQVSTTLFTPLLFKVHLKQNQVCLNNDFSIRGVVLSYYEKLCTEINCFYVKFHYLDQL